MGLIKDGKVYRTVEEQVVHLTKAHEEQLTINKNVSRDLQELGISANLGGYNLVRFAFETQGKYYKLANGTIPNPIGQGSDIGDYFEITSHNAEDIPAYGYLIEGNLIAISYSGDFMAEYSQLAVRNVTKGLEMYDNVQYTEFEGSSLNDYNAQDRKKQIFNVIDDLAYGTRTQYASFDLNNDGIYNFVFVGTVNNGRNGYSVYVTNGVDVQEIIEKMQIHDIIEFAENNDTELVDPSAVIGDLYEYIGNNNFEYKGNIRGQKGETGETGAQGEQGIQGVQGLQGIRGEQGVKGEPGRDGIGIIPVGGILNSPSELPEFSTTEIGDGYVVLNTTGSVVAYDLYYHGRGTTEYSIIPNWGGIKGDKGDKGDTGPQGIQGVQGIQGNAGANGRPRYKHSITIYVKDSSFAAGASELKFYLYNDYGEKYSGFAGIQASLNTEIYVPICVYKSVQTGMFVLFTSLRLKTYPLKPSIQCIVFNGNNGFYSTNPFREISDIEFVSDYVS